MSPRHGARVRRLLVCATALTIVPSAVGAPPGAPAAEEDGPPRVWIEAGGAAAWMERGSSCWRSRATGTGLCADIAVRPDAVPRLRVRAGQVATIHVVGATPSDVALRLGARVDECLHGQEPSTPRGGAAREIATGESIPFAVGPRDGGIASMLARFPEGDAGYLIHLDVVAGPAGDPPRPCRPDRTAPRLEGLIPHDRFRVLLGLSEPASVVGRVERGDGAGGWVSVRPIVVDTDGARTPPVRLGRLNHHRRYRLVLTIADAAGNTVTVTRRLIVGKRVGGGRRLLTLGPEAPSG